MRTYKDFQKWNIGSSDIASLLLLGCNENGAEPMLLAFGSDGDYSAYIIPDNVEIGEHYKKVAEYTDWLKIYDDSSLVVRGNDIVTDVHCTGGTFVCRNNLPILIIS